MMGLITMINQQRESRPGGDKTRSNIINAAKKLFAAQGFAGTSISQIAAKARVTRSLIFHHFANKEILWKAVKLSFAEHSGLQTNTVLNADQGLLHFLKEVITQRFKLYDENPDVVRMMAWQSLAKDSGALQGGTVASPNSWLNAIKYLQKQGEIKPELDPELIMLLIAGSISGALLPNPAILKNPRKKQAYLELTINALFEALKTI